MRRPLLLIFIIILILGFFITLGKELDNINSDIDITISGVVKDKKEKDKYTQYIIDGYLINDYKRKYDIKIGQIVKVEGNLKDLDKLGFDDFDYGRYIKSCGYKGLINSNYFKVIGKNKFYTDIGKFKIYMRDTFRYLYKDSSNFINSCLLGIKDDLTEEEREKYFEMRIPANMYIWATMNSADQGVFPMDTAFKRRWEFEYLSVNDDEQVAAIKDYVIPMCIKDNKADHYIGWDSLRTRINNILTSEKCKVNEDKLLGPFFISKNMLDEIKNNKEQVDELEAKDEASRTEKDNEALKDMHQKENSYIKAFESKVIMYLFEDVMKMRPENIFIGHNKKNGKMIFSEICKAFEQDGEGIFGIEDLVNI